MPATGYGRGVLLAMALFLNPSLDAQGTARQISLAISDYPPFEYMEQGKAKGLSVEIVQTVFRKMGYEVLLQAYPWKRALHMVQTGMVDGAFSANRTTERETYAVFSKESLFSGNAVFFVLKESPVTYDGQLRSLEQLKIGIDRGSSYGDAYDEAVRQGQITVIESDATDVSFKALLARRIDAYLVNEFVAWYQARNHHATAKIKALSPPFAPSVPAYIMFTRQRDLRTVIDQFDTTLALLKKNGTIQRITRKYAP